MPHSMTLEEFKALFLQMMENKDNRFHPLVWINGDPEIGEGTYIGGLSEIYAENAKVRIGRNCDIASFVAINCADSHKRNIGRSDKNDVRDITIGDNVFIGTHSAILGGAVIGDNCVIAAGTVVRAGNIPPYSLVVGNPAVVKAGYYKSQPLAGHPGRGT
jgi:acetyltransferase-like isoleucine patch superfamily enzyme